MSTLSLLDQVPLIAIFLISAATVLASIRGGFALGLLRRSKEDAATGPVGSVVGAMLGLLAFVLAFTFGIAANRFETRKQLLLDEVNAIGTAMLRADLFPQPQRGEVKTLFKRYVDIRVDLAQADADHAKLVAESEAIQDQIWSRAVAFAQSNSQAVYVPQILQSLNDVFDLHTSRLTVALQYRIPPSIWLALVAVTVFSMAVVGFQFGLAGRNSRMVHVALAISFSAIIWLIADLDRASGGMLRVSQQPMLDLQRHIKAAP